MKKSSSSSPTPSTAASSSGGTTTPPSKKKRSIAEILSTTAVASGSTPSTKKTKNGHLKKRVKHFRWGEMDIRQEERYIEEIKRLKNNELQLSLRCTLLEKQNKLSKEREEELKYTYETTLQRLSSLENRLLFLEKSQKQPGPISSLPLEMLHSVLRYLSLIDIIWSQSVCKSWNHNISLWLKTLDLFPFYNGVNNVTLKKVSKFSNLETLKLTRCKEINNYGMTIIEECFKNLFELDLFGCQVNAFGVLNSLSNLRKLRIGDCKAITDKDLEGLPTQLQELRIEWCLSLKAEGLMYLSNLTNLTSLQISQCDFLRPRGFEIPLAVAKNLRDLTIDRQPFFNDSSVANFSTCLNLRRLNFFWLPIQGTTISSLHALKDLEVLSLRRCYGLTDEGVKILSLTFSNLRVLELRGDSKVTNSGLQHLKNLTSLETLSLRCGKSINDEGLQFLSHLNLKKLHLYDCINITTETLNLLSISQNHTLVKLILNQNHWMSRDSSLAFGITQFLTKMKKLKVLRINDWDYISNSRNDKLPDFMVDVERNTNALTDDNDDIFNPIDAEINTDSGTSVPLIGMPSPIAIDLDT